ncbi:DUF2012 domain-containing protein [Haematococcus lacustris]|uniref:DUF2012 domain-containing protein n=1 Tax=Haematococcus lacustris TaxID=44745 RepID=A0A699YYH1_HAELA|nr:DUF2012 domain-containing protein [Haematococcus lacustris]
MEAAVLKLAEGKDQGVDCVAVLARENEMNQAFSQGGLVFRLLRSEYRHSWEHAMPVVGRAGAAGAYATSKLRRKLSGQAVRERASTCVVWQGLHSRYRTCSKWERRLHPVNTYDSCKSVALRKLCQRLQAPICKLPPFACLQQPSPLPCPAAPAATLVKLFTADGQELQSFVQSDGSFEFEQVPPGSHLLQPFHISYFYPEVKVDVSPKAGLVRATQLGQPKPMPLPTPLQLRPLGELQYYEKRKPVDVWSIVKSPYGLMIVFSLFFIFVMPMLKVDPEEMKEAQAAMRGVLGGGTSATEQPAQQRIAGASR